MPLNLASPGITVREVDLTIGSVNPNSSLVGAIAAPFAKGPVETPTIVSNEQDLIRIFGLPYSTDKQYENWLVASSFLSYGGQLRIVRSSDPLMRNAKVGAAGSIFIKSIDDYNNRGYDENSIRSTKKRIEVLSFDGKGNPVFGGPFFTFDKDTVRKPVQTRYSIEYKKNGNARIVYDDELDMIIYDHLISESNEPAKKYTYIPDGDYEGFKWVNGKWQHIEKVFNQKLEDGQAPVVKPVTEKKLPSKKGN
jgi:hypothetical protein